MEVVLAGDIIGSKKNKPDDYLKIIEPILKQHSKDGMYQIYRGDSFQVWMATPVLGLLTAIKLKAALRKTGTLDVRIALGIGEIKLIDKDIAKSTGTALARSGELLDSLKDREQNIMVNSGGPIDVYMNTALKLALLYMDDWTSNSAAIVFEIYNDRRISLENLFKRTGITQQEIGEKLGIKQATASRRLDRANMEETDALLHLFDTFYKDISHAAIN
jgi:hypothetical protein